jgi:hypothetical protein
MSSRAVSSRVARTPKQQFAAPRWLRPCVMGLTALFLLALFSTEAADSDTWWHLATGKYIWQNHRLPVPDPFSYTTDLGKPQYPGELVTRHFNLTHEWGMQLIFYAVQAIAGIGGLVLLRSCLLTFFCGLTGWLAWRRSKSFYWGVAAALLAASVAITTTADRPYLATFVMIPVTMAAYESRRGLWWLPLGFLVWANCHGGFIMGWVVAASYCAEALYQRLKGMPVPDLRKICGISILAVLATFFNPNGFRVLNVMLQYQSSPLQTHILEWNYPDWWPPDPHNVLMIVTALVLLWARRRVRPVDWLLFIFLGGASSMAVRNVIFIGCVGPVLLATYFPRWKRAVSPIWEYAAAAVLLLAIGGRIASGKAFQLQAADWRYPVEAADFLEAHPVAGQMFNLYEQGGYLMWRLWPRKSVFIDGRALNESVWQDYMHMQDNASYTDGRTTEALLRQYGVQVIVMSGFGPLGHMLNLPAAIVYYKQNDWKLVYWDNKVVIFMRQPPPEIEPLNPSEALNSLEMQCQLLDEHHTGGFCDRSLGEMYLKMGLREQAQLWLARHLIKYPGDPAARREFLLAGKVN